MKTQLTDFSGGLNLRLPESEISPNESIIADNVFLEGGTIRQRTGQKFLKKLSEKELHHLYFYHRLATDTTYLLTTTVEELFEKQSKQELWHDYCFQYRALIYYDNRGTMYDLQNYPVQLIIPPTFTYYNQIHPEGHDIKFIGVNGEEYSFWIKEWNKNGQSKIFIKIPKIDANRIFRFYMYFKGTGQNNRNIKSKIETEYITEQPLKYFNDMPVDKEGEILIPHDKWIVQECRFLNKEKFVINNIKVRLYQEGKENFYAYKIEKYKLKIKLYIETNQQKQFEEFRKKQIEKEEKIIWGFTGGIVIEEEIEQAEIKQGWLTIPISLLSYELSQNAKIFLAFKVVDVDNNYINSNLKLYIECRKWKEERDSYDLKKYLIYRQIVFYSKGLVPFSLKYRWTRVHWLSRYSVMLLQITKRVDKFIKISKDDFNKVFLFYTDFDKNPFDEPKEMVKDDWVSSAYVRLALYQSIDKKVKLQTTELFNRIRSIEWNKFPYAIIHSINVYKDIPINILFNVQRTLYSFGIRIGIGRVFCDIETNALKITFLERGTKWNVDFTQLLSFPIDVINKIGISFIPKSLIKIYFYNQDNQLIKTFERKLPKECDGGLIWFSDLGVIQRKDRKINKDWILIDNIKWWEGFNLPANLVNAEIQKVEQRIDINETDWQRNTITFAKPTFCATFLDECIIVDGEHRPKIYNPDKSPTIRDLAQQGTLWQNRIGSFIHLMSQQGRLFIVDKNRLTIWYSNPFVYDNDDAWKTITNGTSIINFIEMPQAGERITGLSDLFDNLIIFCENSVYCLYGNTPDTWHLKKLNVDVGCIAPKSIAHVENGIYFMSVKGIHFLTGVGAETPLMWSFDNIRADNLAERIDKLFLELNHDREIIKNAQGIVYNNYYYLAVPYGKSQKNNMILVADLRRGQWTTIKDIEVASWALNPRTNELFYGDYDGNFYKFDDPKGLKPNLDKKIISSVQSYVNIDISEKNIIGHNYLLNVETIGTAHVLAQTFILHEDCYINKISLAIGQTIILSDVTIMIDEIDEQTGFPKNYPTGIVLKTLTIKKEQIAIITNHLNIYDTILTDNLWVTIEFEPILLKANKKYCILWDNDFTDVNFMYHYTTKTYKYPNGERLAYNPNYGWIKLTDDTTGKDFCLRIFTEPLVNSSNDLILGEYVTGWFDKGLPNNIKRWRKIFVNLIGKCTFIYSVDNIYRKEVELISTKEDYPQKHTIIVPEARGRYIKFHIKNLRGTIFSIEDEFSVWR